MKHELIGTNERPKRKYESPRIEVLLLEMEQGIAAGSANVGSKAPSDDMIQEWETGDDRETTTGW